MKIPLSNGSMSNLIHSRFSAEFPAESKDFTHIQMMDNCFLGGCYPAHLSTTRVSTCYPASGSGTDHSYKQSCCNLTGSVMECQSDYVTPRNARSVIWRRGDQGDAAIREFNYGAKLGLYLLCKQAAASYHGHDPQVGCMYPKMVHYSVVFLSWFLKLNLL